MAQTGTVPASPPFAKGSIIWERKGPLPVWGWAGVVLALALAYAWWRRRHQPAAELAEATTGQTYVNPALPGDQTSPALFPINVGPFTHNVPVGPIINRPPTGGRETPPATPPIAHNPSKEMTHAQGRAGGSVREFVTYYYGGFAGDDGAWMDWLRINKNAPGTPTTDNIVWEPSSTSKAGNPIFKADQTYRLPGYEVKVFGKYPAT